MRNELPHRCVVKVDVVVLEMILVRSGVMMGVFLIYAFASPYAL